MKTDVKTKVHAGEAEQTHKSKLDQIKTGAKKVRSTGGAEKKAVVTTGKDGSKFLINETEEKFEETAVLRKKKNYVMYEAKLGTEKTQDITKIAGPKPVFKPKPKPVREIEPRVEEKIIMKRKKKEYLDNYQYHETKELRNKKPAVVVHERLSPVIGGSVEEVSYQKTTLRSGSAGKNSRPGGGRTTTTTTTTTRTDMKDSKSSANVRTRPTRPGQDRPGKQDRPTRPPRPESGGPFVTTKTETTRIGKRSGPTAGQAKTTTKTTVTTAQDGISKTQSSTKTTTTRTRK